MDAPKDISVNVWDKLEKRVIKPSPPLVGYS